MDTQQIDLVQDSFRKVSAKSDIAAALFYERLFELDFSLRDLFNTKIEEQGHKFMAMLEVVADGLTYKEAILPAIQGLGLRHSRYGVPTNSYDTVEVALLWMLSQILGDEYTEEVQAAWIDFYDFVAKQMREGATKSA